MALDVERERTWRVASLPDRLPAGTAVSEGDVAHDDHVTVCIRRAGDHHLARVEGRGAGGGAVEWDLTAEQFDALWPLTEGRRLEKVRHVVPVGAHAARVDVFTGAHTGLVLVEVAFGDDDAMAGFRPPDWFGDEVSDGSRGTAAAAED